MRFNAHGWLERDRPDDPPIILMKTERVCRQRGPGGVPRGLVNHYTSAEGSIANMVAMCKRTEKHAPPLTPAEVKAGKKRRNPSWTFLLLRNGTIIQCAPITVGTFAVVGSGNVLGVFGVVNALTIQMEIENHGHLVKIGEKFYRDTKQGEKNPDPRLVVPPQRVFGSAKMGWWATYSGEQQLSAAYLYAALMVKFDWGRPQLSLTHRQFNAPRKVDPGEAWTIMTQPAALAHAELLAAGWRAERRSPPPSLQA